jgi:hypothetical protein
MPSPCTLAEFRTAWLPNVTDAGLVRVIELLEKASPLLIHGAFTRAIPMGCLASHIAWQHPATAHLQIEAGVEWLTRVARLNPATSGVILEWDRLGVHDWELRDALLAACREERVRRTPAGGDDRPACAASPAGVPVPG